MNSRCSVDRLVPRASPSTPRGRALNAPTPPDVTGAWRATPWTQRGLGASGCQGAENAAEGTETSRPPGAMATAGDGARSPGALAATGEDQLVPASLEVNASACSFPSPPDASQKARAISSVAPAPVGAPLAMSTLGKLLTRVPARPSKVGKPATG